MKKMKDTPTARQPGIQLEEWTNCVVLGSSELEQHAAVNKLFEDKLDTFHYYEPTARTFES